MKQIYAIGANNNVLLLQSIGITSFIISSEKDLKEKIDELANQAKIIFISESLTAFLSDYVKKFNEQTYPIILFIPLEGKESLVGLEKLRQEVEKAIGMSLI